MIEFGLNFLYSIQCADREHCTILFVNKNFSQIVATFIQANGSERIKERDNELAPEIERTPELLGGAIKLCILPLILLVKANSFVLI